uniref:Protein kinase domain-containing protein n=1 Tax=Phaeomonas parva TaxID=124430 RepID=A0A7S1UJ38_9STRA|mmetsp:Transcript_7047/g.20569  ORF Transcript_7047/g.20569 Transcript_7047/m.20569 type:complete len:835 (+) Transcript_7047:525-3029(+)
MPMERNVSVSGEDANPRPFEEVYDLREELGRGAFSTVYKCGHRGTGMEFAAKVIDLRPLRLRQAFKIDRLRREYEIMRKLKNPHIIQLEEVFETADTLILVMEYCPGVELFDAIIAQRSCPEPAAAIIFYQCLVALSYLHRKHIIHRDIKPENILLCKADAEGRSTADDPTAASRDYPMVKLLDFGLSKTLSPSEGGSAARTFVGTPCYVAPEVEANAQGKKQEYGTKVDLWSAGALLYVMLIARFPEVDRETYDVSMKTLERAGVSAGAQDLIRKLMEADPEKRLTADAAMAHPWLAEAARVVPVPVTSIDRYESMSNVVEPAIMDVPPAVAGSANAIQAYVPPPATTEARAPPSAREVAQPAPAAGGCAGQRPGANGGATGQVVQYSPLGPLTSMQKEVARCMALAHAAYADSPVVAAEVRRSAIICRTAQVESAALLRRVQQTADSVLDLIPDLELAVREQEPELAMEFFSTVRTWVQRLTDEITRVQGENKNSLVALSDAFEAVASRPDPGLRLTNGGSFEQPKRKLGNLSVEERKNSEERAGTKPKQMLRGVQEFTAKQLTRLVQSLKAARVASDTTSVSGGAGTGENENEAPKEQENMDTVVEATTERQKQFLRDIKDMPEEELLDLFLNPNVIPNNPYLRKEEDVEASPEAPAAASTTLAVTDRDSIENALEDMGDDAMYTGDASPSVAGVADTVRALVLRQGPEPDEASKALRDALKHLEGVDAILHHLQNFWSSTEVIFDTLLQRSDHVERFIKFAHKPRLALRFQERLQEYARFWQGVRSVAVDCITGHCAKAAYAFLQENGGTSINGKMPQGGAPANPQQMST